jgi:hypothetical protein
VRIKLGSVNKSKNINASLKPRSKKKRDVRKKLSFFELSKIGEMRTD